MGYHLGIDLGTTSVAAALTVDGGGAEMFALGRTSVLAPAVVYRSDDGRLISGDRAEHGARAGDDGVQGALLRRLGDPTLVPVGGVPYPITTLLQTVLGDALAQVEAARGGPADGVVLTYPTYWGAFHRRCFNQILDLPGRGRPPLRTASAAAAAAAHYAASGCFADGELIAVYDLGGGSFSTTVLRKHPRGVEILGTPRGRDGLGGLEFDEAIVSHLDAVSDGALSELDPRDPRTARTLAQLRHDVIVAKHVLSTGTETTIPLILPASGGHPVRRIEAELTRTQFEALIETAVTSTVQTLTRALRSARVHPGQLAAVVLLGGGAYIPMVSEMITAAVGRPPVPADPHPDHALALGAALLVKDATSSLSPPRPVIASDPGPPRWSPPSPPPRDDPHELDRPGPQPVQPGTDPGRPVHRDPMLPTSMVRAALVGACGLTCVVALIALIALFADPRTGGLAHPALPSRVASLPVTPTPSPTPIPAARLAVSVAVPSLGPTIPAGPTPHFVAVSPSGRQLYIANAAAGVVTVVDTAVDTVTATIPVPAGPPQFLAFSPDGRTVYVSVWNDARTIHAVSVLDTASNTITATIPVRSRPFVAAVTPDGKELYVPDHDSATASVIDTATEKLLMEIPVAPDPHWIAFSRDGARGYVADHESNLVSVIDTATHTVTATIRVGTSPHSVAMNPARNMVASVNYDASTVSVIDTRTNAVIATVPVGRNPQDVRWSPDGRYAYTVNDTADTISVISAATFTVTATLPTGGSPTSLAITPDGRRGFVSNLDSGTLTVLNLTD